MMAAGGSGLCGNPNNPFNHQSQNSRVPIPGLVAGMKSSMNYGYLPQGSPSMLPDQPTASPLQQFMSMIPERHMAPAGFQIGLPVRICCLTCPEAMLYNGLVGDIVFVHSVASPDQGVDQLLFDVRCPVEDPNNMPPMVPDPEKACVTTSPVAAQMASENRARLAASPMYELSGAMALDEERWLPPFVILSKLPSEKLEPIMSGVVGGAPGVPAGAPTLPPVWRPPIWGAPVGSLPGEPRPPSPMQGPQVPAWPGPPTKPPGLGGAMVAPPGGGGAWPASMRRSVHWAPSVGASDTQHSIPGAAPNTSPSTGVVPPWSSGGAWLLR